jgi:hypothetical protein
MTKITNLCDAIIPRIFRVDSEFLSCFFGDKMPFLWKICIIVKNGYFFVHTRFPKVIVVKNLILVSDFEIGKNFIEYSVAKCLKIGKKICAFKLATKSEICSIAILACWDNKFEAKHLLPVYRITVH